MLRICWLRVGRCLSRFSLALFALFTWSSASAVNPESVEKGRQVLAFLEAKRAAAAGDLAAQFLVAVAYAEGRGIPKDEKEAHRLMLQAAQDSFAPAQYRLALMLEQQGAPEAQVMDWLQRSAQLDYAQAKYVLAMREKAQSKVFGLLIDAAEQGVVEAQYELALRYDEGRGVPRDPVQAFAWHKRAAGQGLYAAVQRLAQHLHDGNGCGRDIPTAIYWWRKAAEDGWAESQLSLAHAYWNGEGVPHDQFLAMQWFTRAAFQNLHEAQTFLGYIYAKAGYYSEAYKWYDIAVRQGYAPAAVDRDAMLPLVSPEELQVAQREAQMWAPQKNQSVKVKVNEHLLKSQGLLQKNEQFLVWAAERGDTKRVASLLAQGVSPRVVDPEGASPLRNAAKGGFVEIANLLLDAGADPNEEGLGASFPLFIATERGDFNMVAALLDAGVDTQIVDRQGRTPLHIAAARADTNVVALLLDRGANVYRRDSTGATPLHLAAAVGAESAADLLIGHDAPLNAKESRGRTALAVAAHEFQSDMVKALLLHGARVSARDHQGLTARDLAERAGNGDIVGLFDSP